MVGVRVAQSCASSWTMAAQPTKKFCRDGGRATRRMRVACVKYRLLDYCRRACAGRATLTLRGSRCALPAMVHQLPRYSWRQSISAHLSQAPPPFNLPRGSLAPDELFEVPR